MNIAILVAGLPPERIGGAETQAARLAARLAPRHAVTVFTRTSSVPSELARQPGCSVVRRCRVAVPGVRFVADIVQTLALLGRSRKRADIILAYQTTIDGLIGVLARILFGIPVIVSIRSDMEYQQDRYRQSRWLSPFVFRHADGLAVQSQTLAEELVRSFEQAGRQPGAAELRAKLFVLPNGLSPGSVRSGEGEGVVYVGRLTKTKDVETLILAMRDCPDERLTVVGDGPERRPLEDAAHGNPNVSFVGMVAQRRVPEILATAKLLVLPSRQEGQPNVIMEAMALGVPVIATRVGGVPDLISHGVSGWLVEPGDVRALADAIRTLSADDGLRRRLAANGVTEIQKYAWPTVLETLEHRIFEIVSRAGTGRGRQERQGAV